MAELSPAARAILKAFDDHYELHPFEENWQELCLAAAMRELAERVAPIEKPRAFSASREECLAGMFRSEIRRGIIAIAIELEAS